MPKRNPINWRNEKRQLKDLKPWEGNPRQGSEKDEEDLKASLDRFGLADPIIINTDNTIIGGHFRTHILQKYIEEFGSKEVDVRVPDRKLNDAEMVELNLRLNKNTAGWDIDKLLNIDPGMLMNVGFGEDELGGYWDSLLATEEDGFNLEKALKEITEPITQMGELWQLGTHRLLCGDSTIITDVEKLMGGEKADMTYNDPPYNIGLDYNKGISTAGKYKGKTEGFKLNDKKKIGDYKEFLQKTIMNALITAKEDCHVYYWCDENYVWLLQQLFQENDLMLRRVCIWIKNNFNMTPQVAYNKVYEACVYATRGKPYLNPDMRNLNEMMNKEIGVGNQTIDDILDIINIWLVKRDPVQSYLHPTTKPVSLHEKPLKRCTKVGDIVMDLFLGSSSTLIACEQLKRKCYGIERDPIFATVGIKRWENFTGLKAKKIG